MNKLEIIDVVYSGYNPKTHTYNFKRPYGAWHYQLTPKELGWFVNNLLTNAELAIAMQKKVNKKFKLMTWFPTKGFYIDVVSGSITKTYSLIDGSCNKHTGLTFDGIDNVPTNYNNSPVYKTKFKMIVAELS